jgi:hypothetical protein
MRGKAAAALVFVLSVGSLPATAHEADLMKPTRAGPIIRGRTTIQEMRDWFGEPTSRKVIRVACVRVRRVKWGDDLKAYINPDLGTADAIFVRSRTITSEEHGDLTLHTRRGLRIDDSERKLVRLYPDADPITHAGHTHYRLKTGRHGVYLMAKVVDDVVIQFESWPYEFC